MWLMFLNWNVKVSSHAKSDYDAKSNPHKSQEPDINLK